MTTPITKPKKSKQIPVSAKQRDWCCGTPITGPHTPGCAYEPVDPDAAAPAPESVPEPPPTPPSEAAPAAAQPRSYGFTKADEADLELPSGSLIRYRKLTKGHLLKLNLIEVMDGFTPELLADVRSGGETSNDAALKALTDPARNSKIFGPIDRVVAAAVIIPPVVIVGPTTETQVNIDDVELEDKIAIFSAAIGEQLEALKSVRDETLTGV
jgi:hypothetical protein